ncbi:MAG: serine hydrolase [Cyanobacteria bacterium P01_H01_bin.162]
MVDNNQASNGHSPFRRYEPPTQSGSSNGKTVASPPRSPQESTTSSSPSSSRRQRQARSRWRQWVQAAAPNRKVTPPTQSAATPSSSRRRSPQAPTSPAATRRPAPSPPSPSSTGPAPQMPSAASNAPDLLQPPGRSPSQPPQRPASSVAKRTRKRPPQRSANNVTPLRRQPVWSTPSDVTTDQATTRRSKPRRPQRNAPRPVLYGIRLLILGTGMAAIAGTVLTSLNPNRNANQAVNTPTEVSTTAAPGQRDVELDQPLPLATELVAVETDLVELEAMTPNLSQSVFFYDLQTGNYIDLNGTEAVAAASTIKVPILVAFLAAVDAGTVRLDQTVMLREDMVASGSGDMQTAEIGTQYTALEVATEMIVTSDNTATNLIIAQLGGIDALNQQFQDWGLEATTLRNMLPDLDGTNTTSSADLVRMMALVEQEQLLSRRSRDRLFAIMQRTVSRDLIPEGLNDQTALVYNKTGDIGEALGDVALVDLVNGRRYLVSILVDRPFNDGRAAELIRRVSGRLHEEMSQPISPVGIDQSAPATPTPAATGADEAAPVPTSEPDAYVEPDAPVSNPVVPPG